MTDDETTTMMQQLAPELQRLLSGMLAPDPADRVSMAEVVAFLSAPRMWFADDMAASAGGVIAVDPERTPSASPAGSPSGSPVGSLPRDGSGGDVGGGSGGGRASAVAMPARAHSPQLLSDEDGTPSSWVSRQALHPVRLSRSCDPDTLRGRSNSFAGVHTVDSLAGGNRMRSSTASVIYLNPGTASAR